MSSSQYRLSKNFMYTTGDFAPDDLDFSDADTFFDERNSMISVNTNFNNFEWYYNYLDSLVKLAGLCPQHKGAYLLDLGYIPVVALPTCCASMEVSMMHALDKIKLPYVKIPMYTFDGSYKYNLAGLDAWASKLDIEQILGIPFKDVRSVDVARRIFDA